MQYIGMNYIGGFLPTRADFGSYNVFTDELIGYFPQTTLSEIDEAIQTAQKSHQYWAYLDYYDRNQFFQRLKELFSKEELQKDVFETILAETGIYTQEIHKAIYCIENACIAASSITGVVAIIANSNCSFSNMIYNIMHSLLEGNVVIFKASYVTPTTCQLIASYFQEVGFPPGVFNLLHGNEVVEQNIINDERIFDIVRINEKV